MVGVSGAYDNIQKGIKNLLKAGYKDLAKKGRYKLGASFVVNKLNLDEVQSIWRFCRANHIIPNLEMMIPNGMGKENLRVLPGSF